MDHEALAGELLRELRGERSQTAFSRHLGYKCNVLYTWESGRRWPTAATFFRVAAKARVDWPAQVRLFLGSAPQWLPSKPSADEGWIVSFLEELRGSVPLVEVARRMRIHRATVSRWLNGKAQPKLPEFLHLVDVMSERLMDFVALFVEPSRLPACNEAWCELLAQREVAYHLPWSHAVMRVLELSEYRAMPAHEQGYIARKLSIPVAVESLCLDRLAAAGLIVKRHRRWEVVRVLTVDTRAQPDAGRVLKSHWAGLALDRLAELEPNKVDLFSYNLFAVSEHDWLRIRERHIAYFQELRAIVAQSTPAERVVLVNLQLLRLDEPVRVEE
jgi:transcriptional regulator with XRE-family HTH domain